MFWPAKKFVTNCTTFKNGQTPGLKTYRAETRLQALVRAINSISTDGMADWLYLSI